MFTLHPLQLTNMFITLLLAKKFPQLSYILHYIIQASYKHKMCIQRWYHMQSTLCSFVCCCYWNMGIDLLYSIEGIQINITLAMYNLHVQCTCSPNYRLEPKCSKEARVKKKLNRSLTCKQRINLCSIVAYTLHLQILFGLHVQIHCRIFEQKVQYVVQNLLIDWLLE